MIKTRPTDPKALLIHDLKLDLELARYRAQMIDEKYQNRAAHWRPTADPKELNRRRRAHYNNTARLKVAQLEGGAILTRIRELENGTSKEIADKMTAAAHAAAAPADLDKLLESL